jgi:glycosyltransferase involved in cell wall biosynthesis
MPLPKLHMVACFHTQLTDEFSHCAFSGKCRRWPKMMALQGWKTVMYTNGGSDVPDAEEVVDILSVEEFEKFYPRPDKTAFHGNHAVIGERGWPTFNSRLIVELAKRVQPGDIILHPFGRAHSSLIEVFPQCTHVESGIGYSDKPFGAWRIFESEVWRHYHWGHWDHDASVPAGERGQNRYYSWVVPNYFDLEDWTVGDGKRDYVVFMGRITPEKGMTVIAAIIRAYAERCAKTKEIPPRFVFAGQGNFENEVMKHVLGDPKPAAIDLNIEYVGPVHGRARSELINNARCMLMPTSFIEPFAGAGVEAMLCGTPLVSVDYGAFVETVIEGVTGFRCNTLGDWVHAIEATKGLDRQQVAAATRARYSLEACAKKYDQAFRQLNELRGAGWYSSESHRNAVKNSLLPLG